MCESMRQWPAMVEAAADKLRAYLRALKPGARALLDR